MSSCQKACISNIVVISETLAVEDKRSEKYSASLRARDYKYSAEPALKMLVCNKLFRSTSSAFAHESLVELLFIIHGDTNFRILLGMPKVKCFDDMLPNNNNNHDIPSLASNINHTTEFPLLINKLLNTARNIFSAAMLKKYNLAPQHADFVKFEHPTETLSCIYLISLSIDVYLARTSKKNQLSVRELISNCCNFFEKFLSDTNFFLSLSSALSLMRMIQINKTAMHNQIKLDDKNKFTLEYVRKDYEESKRPFASSKSTLNDLMSEFPTYFIALKIKQVINTRIAKSSPTNVIFVVRANICHEKSLKIELKKHFPRIHMKELDILPGEIHLLETKIKSKFR